jgi:hypothetical protein
MNNLSPELTATRKWPLSSIICWIFVMLYAVSIHYNGFIFADETEYLSIAKSFAHGSDFSIFNKPSIIVPAWPFLLSSITALGLSTASTILLCHILSALLSILNLFIITAFLRRIKINGAHLPDFQVVMIQLLTFGNLYFMGSAGNLYPENFSIMLLFVLILTLYSGVDLFKALLAGLLFGALCMVKYVAIPAVIAFPVYYLYLYKWRLKTFAYSLVSIIAACLIIVPFYTRMGYINSHHLSDFDYMKYLLDKQHASGLELYLLSIRQGFTFLFLRFHELFTTLNKDTHFPHVDLVFSILSFLFLIPIIAFIVQSVRNRQIFEFPYVFTIVLIGSLILIGTGFTRYWLLVLPIINLMFIRGLLSFGFLQKPLFAGIEPKKWMTWSAMILFFIAALYCRFLTKDIWAFKTKAVLITTVSVALISVYIYALNAQKTAGMVLVFLLIIWADSRAIAQNPVMYRPMQKDEVLEMNRQHEVNTFIETLPTDSTPFVMPYYKAWPQAYSSIDMRNESALYDLRYKSFYVFWFDFLDNKPDKLILLKARPWDKQVLFDKNGIKILKLTDKSR